MEKESPPLQVNKCLIKRESNEPQAGKFVP